jgi:hypothetical protein
VRVDGRGVEDRIDRLSAANLTVAVCLNNHVGVRIRGLAVVVLGVERLDELTNECVVIR